MNFIEPEPPHNAEAEEALIGGILMAPTLFRECAAIVSGGDFYNLGWGHAWTAFGELDKAGKPIDVITVVDQLDKSKLNGSVSASELIAAFTGVPHAHNSLAYAQMIADHAGRRRLLTHASECARIAHASDVGFLDGLERAKVSIDSIPVISRPSVTSLTQLDNLTNEIEGRMKSPKEVWGITTGFSDLDKRTGGWQKGEFSLLCGPPGIGKSMLMGQMALAAARVGSWVKIYSAEMRHKPLWRRLLSFVSGVDSRKMRSGFIDDWEWDKIMGTASDLSNLHLNIIDDSGISLAQIRADIYKSKKETGVDIVFIDYFDKIAYPEKEPLIRDKMMSAEMKTIADKEDVALVVVHSMPKIGIESRVPDVQDASGSIIVVHNSDNTIFMVKHIPESGETQNPRMRTLLFPKMRDLVGPQFMNLVQLHDRPGFGQVEDHRETSSDSDYTNV